MTSDNMKFLNNRAIDWVDKLVHQGDRDRLGVLIGTYLDRAMDSQNETMIIFNALLAKKCKEAWENDDLWEGK